MNDTATGPDVPSSASWLVLEALGWHVVNCSKLLACADLASGCDQHFTNSEVTQLQLAIFIHKDVLWLQVGVQNVLLVQMLEPLHYLEQVPENLVLWHEVALLFVKSKLASQMSV